MRQSHIAIIGAPMDLGAGRRGVDMGPSALRVAGLNEKLAQLGYAVDDLGNIVVDQPESLPAGPVNARYLPQIAHTCARLAEMVEQRRRSRTSAAGAGRRSFGRDRNRRRHVAQFLSQAGQETRPDLDRRARRHEHSRIEPQRQRARHAAGVHASAWGRTS